MTSGAWKRPFVTESGGTGGSGEAGVDGKSAYELAVEGGFIGTLSEWIDSLEGDPGQQGVPGSDGATGPAGPTGPAGAMGAQGIKGDTGATGAAGPGLPAGGAVGQVLQKTGAADYQTGWGTPSGGGTSVAVGSFSAFKSVQQSDIASGTDTKVTFETEQWDVSDWYDPATSRYTPKLAGYYEFNVCLAINPCVDQKFFGAKLYKNNIQEKHFLQVHTSGSGPLIASGVVRALSNGSTDFFEFFAFHNFGVNTSDLLSNQSFAYVQGSYLGSAA